MKRNLVLVLILFFVQIGVSQELQATVSINYQQVNNGNPQLFINLEKQVKEFLNNTKWTEREILDVEKIECNFFINISNAFKGVFFVPLRKGMLYFLISITKRQIVLPWCVYTEKSTVTTKSSVRQKQNK
jgi:hypothetical protein